MTAVALSPNVMFFGPGGGPPPGGPMRGPGFFGGWGRGPGWFGRGPGWFGRGPGWFGGPGWYGRPGFFGGWGWGPFGFGLGWFSGRHFRNTGGTGSYVSPRNAKPARPSFFQRLKLWFKFKFTRW